MVRIKDQPLVTHLHASREINHLHVTTTHLDIVLVMSNLSRKNLSMHQGPTVETVTISKKNNTLIKSQTSHLHFPAKIQEPFYPIQRRINKVFTKCRRSLSTSSTFRHSSNKSMYQIPTLVKLISIPNL